MKASVNCVPTAKGVHSFFLVYEGERYFLFKQDYRKGVQRYYAAGVSIEQSIAFDRAHKDRAIMHTMEKLLPRIKQVEKESGISVLRQSSLKESYKRHLGNYIVK